MNTKYITTLMTAGLTKVEAEVYLCCLALGNASVKEIAQKVSVDRPNIYRVLDILIKKNLVYIEYRGLKRRFVAAAPNMLNLEMQNLQTQFQNLLPEIQQLYDNKKGGGESSIKIFQGTKQLNLLYDELLGKMRKNDFYYVISNVDKWYELDKKGMEDFHKRRVEKDLHIKFILQEGKMAEYYKKFQKNFNQDVKILPKEVVLDSDTIVL